MIEFQARDYKGDIFPVTVQGTELICSMPEINLYWTRDEDGDHIQYGFSHLFFFNDALRASHFYGECILHANPVDEFDWLTLVV